MATVVWAVVWRDGGGEVHHSGAPEAGQKVEDVVSLDEVDWSSVKVPAQCAGDTSTVATLSNYVAQIPGGGTVRLHADGIVTGQVAGLAATAVTLGCEGASASPDAVLVYTDSNDGVVFAGYAVSPDEQIQGAKVTFAGDEIRITGSSNTENAPRCCPDLQVTSRFTLDDGLIVQIARQVTSRVDEDSGEGAQPACSMLPQVREKVRMVRELITDLSGGSVEGVPTYSEADTYQNMAEITSLKARLLRMQQVQRGLEQRC